MLAQLSEDLSDPKILNKVIEEICKNDEPVRKIQVKIKTMRRLDRATIDILEHEFSKNPNWSKNYIKVIAQKTGIDARKVYKWNWDKKKLISRRRVYKAPNKATKKVSC